MFVSVVNNIQLTAELLNPPKFLSLDYTVNGLCSIERCGGKILQIIANMLSQYLLLELKLLRRTTLSSYLLAAQFTIPKLTPLYPFTTAGMS